MFQFERASVPYGSQKSIVNHLATSVTSSSLSRSLVVVPLTDFTTSKLDELLQRDAEAILILLPKVTSITNTEIENWKRTEQELFKRSISIPIFFAWEDQSLKALYQDIERLSADGDRSSSLFGDFLGGSNQYQFVSSASETTPIKEISITNFEGWLSGATLADGETRSTIAVVAHYDSFSVAPGLSSGADSGASGAVAVLELARLFHKLYSEASTQSKYNLIFVLTGGGNLNYVGAKHWLDRTDIRLLDTVKFALCLDSLAGSSSSLNLHVSRLPKEQHIQKLYESFNSTAKSLGVDFNIVHKKINVSSSDVDWEHEQFSLKKIVAATLSHESSPSSPLTKSHLYDRHEKVSVDVLVKNIRFIAETLGKHIYGHDSKDLEIFVGGLAVSKEYVETWLQILTSHTSAAPYTNKKSPLLSSLAQGLKQHTSNVNNQTFLLESEYVFYEGAEKTSMSVYRSKPVSFDVILLVLITAYLGGMFTVLKGPQEAMKQLKKFISGSSKKSAIKKKSS